LEVTRKCETTRVSIHVTHYYATSQRLGLRPERRKCVGM